MYFELPCGYIFFKPFRHQSKLYNTPNKFGTITISLKGIQWLKIIFCVHFTYSILGIVALVKKIFDINSTLFLSF